MDSEVRAAIREFFRAASKLRTLNVIRSDSYLGDIGEYICGHFYKLELAKSGRQPGHDGSDADGLVQVKYHGSSTRTNINLGDPSAYDHVVVVLGPNSLLRPKGVAGDFLVYRIKADAVTQHANPQKGTYSCGRSPFLKPPDQILNLEDLPDVANAAAVHPALNKAG